MATVRISTSPIKKGTKDKYLNLDIKNQNKKHKKLLKIVSIIAITSLILNIILLNS